MKKIIAFFIASICLSMSAYIQADIQAEPCFENYCDDPCCDVPSNFYAEIFGGANFLQTETKCGIKSDYDTGYIVSGSLGYFWHYGLRLEAEYAYRRNSYRKVHFFGRGFGVHGHFQSSSYMANLLWDVPLLSCRCINLGNVQPFTGAGIGYDFQQIHGGRTGLNFKESKKHFAWQVIAGLEYPLFCNTDISIEYKFHKGGFNHIYSHSIGAGIKYKFGLGL